MSVGDRRGEDCKRKFLKNRNRIVSTLRSNGENATLICNNIGNYGFKAKFLGMEGGKAVGRNSLGAGRTVLLILIGAALGTLVGFGLEKYGILAPFLRPAVIDVPSHTYIDFFFLSLSFGFRLSITIATILGALGGYFLSRKG